MRLADIFLNRVLVAALIAWMLAQIIKVPFFYLQYRRWNWGLWFSAGGMPSSHSALITAATIAIGLYEGFDSPLFALAVAIAMIVVYDAAGVRRQAGLQARKINLLITQFLSGQKISEERLKEVIGHTPRQVLVGILLGLVAALVTWLVWSPN